MIEIGKYAGFCGGVQNSINKTLESLDKYDKIYCLGDLVHNKEVVEDLSSKGIIFINNIDEAEDNSNVIVRAHGIPTYIYVEASKRGINLIDLTCPKVLKIHDRVSEYSKKGYYVILIGNKTHPEVVGTVSFASHYSIVEDEEDIINLLSKIKDYDDIVILCQTTYSIKEFDNLTKRLREVLSDKNLVIENTICNATTMRQEECKEMAKKKDCMIIIGGRSSSNTKKLYEVAKEYCNNTYLIETYKDLDIEEIKKYKNIGIVAGASTPKLCIDEVVERIS